MNANDEQIGGTHYSNNGGEQHWDVVRRLGWCYLVGCATKYLWRQGRKGDEEKKLEDVEKSIHYLRKKAEQLREELDRKRTQKKPAPRDNGEPGRGYTNQD